MDYRIASQERQLHHDRVARIDRHIDEILADPHERDRARESLSGIKEIQRDRKRQQHLESRTHQDVDELPEENEYGMAGFMEDEIRIIDEVPIVGRARIVYKVRAREKRDGCAGISVVHLRQRLGG